MSVSGATLQNGLPTFESVLRRQLSNIVDKATKDTAAHAIEAIQTGPKSGRVYGSHQASAPGEAPATDLGNLAAGITGEMVSELTGEVIVAAEYGPVLEFGGAEIEPRPFLQPSLDTVSPSFEKAAKVVARQAGVAARVTR